MRLALDAWFSLMIRQRDGRCRLRLYAPEVACTPGLQCCHIFSRRFDFTAYDPENARAGCPAHHAFFTYNPDRWDEARAAMLGPHGLRVLRDRAMHSTGHFDFSTLYKRVVLGVG